MHRNDDESDFQAGGEGVDKGDDQDDRSQGCSSRIDRTEGDRDLNNESGCETEDLRGSYGCGPEAPSTFLSKLSDEEQHRYEAFRRAHLTKTTVKRLVQSILGHGIAGSTVIVIQSAGKLFVGELVKIALEVMDELGEDGPLQPSHVREAFSRLQQRSSLFRSLFLEPGLVL